MSYDLYLFSPKLKAESVNRFFANRPHYKDGFYSNDDTGVYFRFDYVEPDSNEEDEDAPPETRHAHVTFNMNYFRPHTFGLEAEPELTAFVAEFGCTIIDPQNDGPNIKCPYSPEEFLRGWNAGNVFGYRAIVGQGGGGNVLIVDDVLIEKVWSWNRGHQALQAMITDHFIPTANWAVLHDGTPIVYVVWGEGVLVAIPDFVTHVLLARKRRLFAGTRPGFEARLVSVSQAETLRGCEWNEHGATRLLFAPKALPYSREALDFFDKGLGEFDDFINQFATDKVVDRSIMETIEGKP